LAAGGQNGWSTGRLRRLRRAQRRRYGALFQIKLTIATQLLGQTGRLLHA
jgi:hypothetical protein